MVGVLRKKYVDQEIKMVETEGTFVEKRAAGDSEDIPGEGLVPVMS